MDLQAPESLDQTRSSAPGGRSGRRRLGPRLLALALSCAAALVGAEFGLRHVLFGSSALAERLGPYLRKELLYVTSTFEDDYWKLQVLLDPQVALTPPTPDPLLGWTGSVRPGTYRSHDEFRLQGRRPVLLYGDSNAQCMTGRDDCFQGLLESSELGETHAMLNYGVGGYGLDQIYLMLRSSLDHFADQNPLVIVSFLVDDDLERSVLPIRCWPKPRFHVEDGVLIEPEPVQTDTLRFVAENPPSIRSYLYRLLTVGRMPRNNRPTPSGSDLTERIELNRALLQAIHAELESREVDYFFFLFYLRQGMRRAGGSDWAEDVVLEFLESSGAPSVSMREFIETLCGAPWHCLDQLIGTTNSPLRGHLNPLGNRLFFEAMRQGIEGRFSDFDFGRALAIIGELLPQGKQRQPLRVLGRSARVVSRALYTCWRYEESDARGQGALLGLRAGNDSPTLLELDLGGNARRLEARARASSGGSAPCQAGTLRLRVRLDRGEWREELFELGEAPRPFEIDLTGAGMLTLQVEYDGPDPMCAWMALDHLRVR